MKYMVLLGQIFACTFFLCKTEYSLLIFSCGFPRQRKLETNILKSVCKYVIRERSLFTGSRYKRAAYFFGVTHPEMPASASVCYYLKPLEQSHFSRSKNLSFVIHKKDCVKPKESCIRQRHIHLALRHCSPCSLKYRVKEISLSPRVFFNFLN